MAAPVYPANLTKAAWDKQKGILAKMLKKETGVGAACDKAKAAFDKVNWGAFDAGKGAGLATFELLEAYYEAMKVEHGKSLVPAREALLELAKICDKTAGEFKLILLIPKSSREYVEKMSKDAINLVALVKGYPDPAIRAVQGAMAKKSEMPKLKASVETGGFKAIEANAKLMAAFRDFISSKHAGDQMAAYEAAKINASGKRAAELYLKYIKVGSAMEANVAASDRKVFDLKYLAYSKSKKDSDMSGLPWKNVATTIITEMLGPMAKDFGKEFDKFYAKYV